MIFHTIEKIVANHISVDVDTATYLDTYSSSILYHDFSAGDVNKKTESLLKEVKKKLP